MLLHALQLGEGDLNGNSPKYDQKNTHYFAGTQHECCIDVTDDPRKDD